MIVSSLFLVYQCDSIQYIPALLMYQKVYLPKSHNFYLTLFHKMPTFARQIWDFKINLLNGCDCSYIIYGENEQANPKLVSFITDIQAPKKNSIKPIFELRPQST